MSGKGRAIPKEVDEPSEEEELEEITGTGSGGESARSALRARRSRRAGMDKAKILAALKAGASVAWRRRICAPLNPGRALRQQGPRVCAAEQA